MDINDQDILRVASVWDNSISGQVVNQFHIKVSIAVPPASEAAVGIAVGAWLEELYDGTDQVTAMHESNVHSEVFMFNVTQNAPLVPLSGIAALDGEGGGEIWSTGTAALVIGRTGISHKVGKKYLPPFNTGVLLSGLINPANLAIMQDWANFWAAEYNYASSGISLQAVIANQAETVFSPIVAAQAVPTPAYQRRRKRGRGA